MATSLFAINLNRYNQEDSHRLVPLPESTLRVLKNFWSLHRHPLFIFPNRKRGLKNAHLVDSPLERGGVQTAMKAVVEQIGIKKKLVATPCVTVTRPICWKPVST